MKVVIKIKDNSLYFSIYKKTIDENLLNNTNIIDTQNLIFSTQYIKENKQLLSSFLNVIVIKNNIHNIIIKQMDIADICISLVNEINSITSVTINDNKDLSFNAFFELEKSNFISSLNCNSLLPFMFDKLSFYKKIKINTRLETVHINEFMIENKLDKYSKIYYTKSLTFNDVNDEDIEYINMVLEINSSLKKVYINNVNYDLIIKIIDLLIEKRKRNIKIYLNVNSSNAELLNNNLKKIKKLNKIINAKYNLNIKINYTKEYINSNRLKQLNLNTSKIITMVIIITIIIIFYIYYLNLINSKKSINKLNNIVEEVKKDVTVEKEIEPTNNINENSEQKKEPTVTIDYNENYYKTYTKVFNELKKINNETVAWITINNTTIDYPIVQHSDNDYYLNKDFYKKTNLNGWLFMDYRNTIDNLNDNTIIYGHETDLKIMFGDLKKTLKDSWYKNKDNQIIIFNTLYSNMKFQIFSIYTIDDTNDYLYNQFYDNNEKIKFLNKLKNRSIYNFNIELNETDKILTLSTCYKNNKKLVLHAKLIV